MGAVKVATGSVWRDYNTDGVRSSGLKDPSKLELRALGTVIEAAIGNAALGALVSVAKDTKAHLLADLTPADAAVALVYADDVDEANNGLWVKSGATGVGGWAQTTAFQDMADTLIGNRLNLYDVSIDGFIVVDEFAGVVHYPRFIIGREGFAFKNVAPTDYTGVGSTFSVPLAAPGSSDVHYLDVTMVAPGQTDESPVKTVTGGAFVQLTLGAVPIGRSFSGNFQAIEGVPVIHLKNLRPPSSLVFRNNPVFYDPDGLWGGGAQAIYVPTGAGSYLYNIIERRTVAEVLDPASIERPGYCKIVFPNNVSAWAAVVDPATGEISMVEYTDLSDFMAANPTNFILLASRFGSGEPQFYLPVTRVTQEYLAAQYTPEMLVSDHLFLIEGRPLDFYPTQVFSERHDRPGYCLSFVAKPRTGRKPYVCSGETRFEIEGDKCGTTGTFFARPYKAGASGKRMTRDVTIHVAPSTGTGTVPVLLIGDSITARMLGEALAVAGAEIGYTIHCLGTIPYGATVSGFAQKHEGRESIPWAAYTNADDDFATPVADNPAALAAYMALSPEEKMTRNIFLRTATVGDPPGEVKNGQIFDLGFYLTRTGQPDPRIVFVALGTNDLTQLLADVAAAKGQIGAGFDIFLARIRDALPYGTTDIVFMVHSLPHTDAADARWPKHVEALILGLMDKVNAAREDDDQVWFLGLFPHVSPDFGWELSSGTTDPVTGMKSRDVSDGLHYQHQEQIGAGVDQAAQALLACLHNIVVGI